MKTKNNQYTLTSIFIVLRYIILWGFQWTLTPPFLQSLEFPVGPHTSLKRNLLKQLQNQPYIDQKQFMLEGTADRWAASITR